MSDSVIIEFPLEQRRKRFGQNRSIKSDPKTPGPPQGRESGVVLALRGVSDSLLTSLYGPNILDFGAYSRGTPRRLVYALRAKIRFRLTSSQDSPSVAEKPNVDGPQR